MYAVVRTGSKQYKVEAGQEFLVEKLEAYEAGQPVELNDVLLVSDGDKVQVGTPLVPMAVHCTCVGLEKGPKIRSLKYRRRKSSRKTLAHRQVFTRLKVERIEKKG